MTVLKLSRMRFCASVCLSHQGEVIIRVHQLIYAMLFQHHHPCQTGVPNPSAVLTVNHISLPATVLTGHEQQVKYLHLFTHMNTYMWRWWNMPQGGIICSCRWCFSRRIRCSSMLARPSPCSDSRSSSLQTPAGPSKSECVWWTEGDNVCGKRE